jgi:hypothetical protein
MMPRVSDVPRRYLFQRTFCVRFRGLETRKNIGVARTIAKMAYQSGGTLERASNGKPATKFAASTMTASMLEILRLGPSGRNGKTRSEGTPWQAV